VAAPREQAPDRHVSYLPQRPGYHKRLKAALPLLKRMIRELAMDSDFWTDAHSASIPARNP
jgi:hypothetical protein